MNAKVLLGLLSLVAHGRCDAEEKVYNPDANNLDQYATGGTPISSAFYGYEVVPDVISRPPRSLAIVRFEDGINLYLGDLFIPEPDAVPRPPAVLSWPSDPSKNYTILLVDPDVPSRENAFEGQFIHWLVINVPGGNYQDGRTVLNFVLTLPKYRIGLHRYVLLIYQQNSTLNLNINSRNFNRLRFSVANFARRNQLGYPVAGNFGRVQYGEPNDNNEYVYYVDDNL